MKILKPMKKMNNKIKEDYVKFIIGIIFPVNSIELPTVYDNESGEIRYGWGAQFGFSRPISAKIKIVKKYKRSIFVNVKFLNYTIEFIYYISIYKTPDYYSGHFNYRVSTLVTKYLLENGTDIEKELLKVTYPLFGNFLRNNNIK